MTLFEIFSLLLTLVLVITRVVVVPERKIAALGKVNGYFRFAV